LSAILQGLNTKKTKKIEELPTDYVIAKFFELGFYPKHNRFNDTYQCSCPICKEGKSFGKKKRCFYIPENNLIYCHNCGWSSNPLKWIMRVSGMNYHDVCREISDESYDLLDIMSVDESIKIKKTPSLPDDCINLFDNSQISYYSSNNIVQSAIKYLKDRRLDTAVNRPSSIYISLKDKIHKNRLVLPFKDISNQIIFYQSRKIFDWDKNPSYLSKINADKSIFNIENVDMFNDDTIYMFEGPIDSCFVKNGVGVAGINSGIASFTPKQEEQLRGFKLFDKIWCLDSQYIDNTSKEKTLKLLENGEKVFIWPEKIGKKYKDFNEMCIDKKIDQVPIDFIKKNSQCGPSAILKFKLLFNKI